MANEVRDTTGLKAAVSILEKWGATGEQITRISLVLNMHAALRVLFDNPENLYGFMAMANHNAYFQGWPPSRSSAAVTSTHCTRHGAT